MRKIVTLKENTDYTESFAPMFVPKIKKPMQINDLHGLRWDRADLNRRHTDFQSVALPTELQSLSTRTAKIKGL